MIDVNEQLGNRDIITAVGSAVSDKIYDSYEENTDQTDSSTASGVTRYSVAEDSMNNVHMETVSLVANLHASSRSPYSVTPKTVDSFIHMAQRLVQCAQTLPEECITQTRTDSNTTVLAKYL